MLNWVKELDECGWDEMLLDRMRFHGGLQVKDVAEETGRSMQTVKGHFKRLVNLGRAQWGYNSNPDEIGFICIEGVKKRQ